MRAATIMLLALAASASAQDATPGNGAVRQLEGRVRFGGAPLEGASVSVINLDESTPAQTDSNGNFGIPVAGETPLIQVEHTMVEGTMQLARRVRQKAAPDKPFDVDMRWGGGILEGRITKNGEPIESASVALRWTAESGAACVICALTGDDGHYRIDGLPEGSREVEITPRHNSLVVGINRMGAVGVKALPVVLRSDSVTQLDFEIATGDMCARVPEIRDDEAGRLLVVPGSFSGTYLSIENAQRLMRNVAAVRDAGHDTLICIPDLPEGTYVVFFGATTRPSRVLERMLKSMRLTYANVHVEAGHTSNVELKFN